jgi:transcriptional regulator
MYLPSSFAETDLTTLHNFIEQYSFGLLVSSVEGLPFASHLPLLLERASGPHGTLVGHMARANPQWREASGQTALAIFTGPHAYISPAWYEAEEVVPTWNYTTVHAYGRVQIIGAAESLREIVAKTVQVHEQSMPRPWQFDGSGTFVERQLKQIVGFRIPINKIEGKWKLNQNHPVERRKKVFRALQQRSGENAQAVAALMQAMLPAEETRRPDAAPLVEGASSRNRNDHEDPLSAS